MRAGTATIATQLLLLLLIQLHAVRCDQATPRICTGGPLTSAKSTVGITRKATLDAPTGSSKVISHTVPKQE